MQSSYKRYKKLKGDLLLSSVNERIRSEEKN
jgi:hypothetical protein